MLHSDIEEILRHYGITKGWETIPGQWKFSFSQGAGCSQYRRAGAGAYEMGLSLAIQERADYQFTGRNCPLQAHVQAGFQQKRCIVPANAFFEWSRAGRDKTKYQFRMKQSSIFSLAGIYEDFQNDEGESYTAFSILTINPNPLVSLIHDRMPVILPREKEELWLDNTVQDIPLLKSLIQPYDESQMEMEKAHP